MSKRVGRWISWPRSRDKGEVGVRYHPNNQSDEKISPDNTPKTEIKYKTPIMTPQEQPFDKHENNQPQLHVYIYTDKYFVITDCGWKNATM